MNDNDAKEPVLPIVTDGKSLGQNVNKMIRLRGKSQDMPLQHLMGRHFNYPFTTCIDLSDGTQVPVYLKTKFNVKGSVEIIGHVIAIHTKGPDGVNSVFSEYQLVAESWKTPV
jgi:hypothetical protein